MFWQLLCLDCWGHSDVWEDNSYFFILESISDTTGIQWDQGMGCLSVEGCWLKTAPNWLTFVGFSSGLGWTWDRSVGFRADSSLQLEVLSGYSIQALVHYGLSKCIIKRTEISESFPVYFHLCIQNYLDNFWPDLKAAHELFDSIVQARQERESESQENHGKEYPEHLPVEVLEAGIKSGRYQQVFVIQRAYTEPVLCLVPWAAWIRVIREGNMAVVGRGKENKNKRMEGIRILMILKIFPLPCAVTCGFCCCCCCCLGEVKLS